MTTIQQHFACNGVASTDFTCGCEFEIEDVKGLGKLTSAQFIVEEDASLRNNGKEFKTHPNGYTRTLELFKTLHEQLVLGPEPFTERTSTHVHVNVAHLTLCQTRQLVLTYALLEPVLFKFVGDKRANSIFCVPLNFTYLPGHYKNDITTMHSKWHKYTAFNIRPLNHLGTVEFRHLYGTNNEAVFTTWLSTLKELYEFIRDTPDWDVVKALQTATPYEVAQQVIPTLTKVYQQAEIHHLLKDTSLDVKLSVGGLK